MSCGLPVGRQSYAASEFLGSFNLLLIISEVVPQRYALKGFTASCFFFALPFSVRQKVASKQTNLCRTNVSLYFSRKLPQTENNKDEAKLSLYCPHTSLDHWPVFDCILEMPFLIHEAGCLNHQVARHPTYSFFCVPMAGWSYPLAWFITHSRYPLALSLWIPVG